MEMSETSRPRPAYDIDVAGSIASAWGALGVMYILLSPLKRLLPIAVQPFQSPGDLSTLGWASYALWVAMMAYMEGYKVGKGPFPPFSFSSTQQHQPNPHPNRVK